MYCPNCGAELPDDAEFCRNCGAKVKRDSVGLQNTGPQMAASAEKTKKRLAPGWIVLIALVCVAVILAAVMIPIYAKAPVLPVSSSTSDGKSSFTYDFDKKTGLLTISGTLKGASYEDDSFYNKSPYVLTQWLIALCRTSNPYETQLLQLCTMDEYTIPGTLSEYVLGINDYVVNGTIKRVEYSFENLDDSTVNDSRNYEFEAADGRVNSVRVESHGINEGTTTYSYSYDEQGRIHRIWDDDNTIDETYVYDEKGILKDIKSEDALGFDIKNDGQHVTYIQHNIGLNTGAEATYTFNGNALQKVKTEEGSSWGGGGYHISNVSQFSYQKNRVSQINTSVDAKGEDASGGSGNFSFNPQISLSFQYKRIL